MTEAYWITMHDAGRVRNIDVMVCQKEGEDQFEVILFNSFEGLTEIGQPFVGKNALREATILANLIFSAVETASITWEAAQ